MVTLVLLMTLFEAGPPVEAEANPAPDRRESFLRDHLWNVSREVDLGGAKAINELYDESLAVGTEAEALEEKSERRRFVGPLRPCSQPLRQLAASRDDLRGLPFLPEDDTELEPSARSVLRHVSAGMKSIDRGGGYGTGIGVHTKMVTLFDSVVTLRDRTGYVAGPRLEQVAMGHGESMRASLITALSWPGPAGGPGRGRNPFHLRSLLAAVSRNSPVEARRTIARRAVFDTSQDVRRLAREALRGGDPADVRPVLLAALRHPWPPAAEHAAEALVRLEDVVALPTLREMVKLSPPDEPRREGGRWVRRGLARIDHLRNCLLCHPAAGKDPPRSAVVAPIPPLGRASERASGSDLPHVYAHIVFLRPDTSAVYLRYVGERRFDFVQADQTMTEAEHKEYLARRAESPFTYPQREAVRWAISKLSR